MADCLRAHVSTGMDSHSDAAWRQVNEVKRPPLVVVKPWCPFHVESLKARHFQAQPTRPSGPCFVEFGSRKPDLLGSRYFWQLTKTNQSQNRILM